MIKAFNPIRFLLALCVFLGHYLQHDDLIGILLLPVSAFFILSGYVMTLGYADKIYTNKDFCYKEYLLKRFFKLFPLNLLCLLLYLILPLYSEICHGIAHPGLYVSRLLDLLMLQSWIPIEEVYFSGNSVAWFLSDIFFCYMMFPYIIRLHHRKYSNEIFISVLILYMGFIQLLPKSSWHYFIYVCPITRLVDFVLGIKLCYIVQSYIDSKKLPSYVLATFFEISVIVVFVMSIFVASNISLRYAYASFCWIPSILLIGTFAVRRGGISCLLENNSLVFWGLLSFLFFMLHDIFIRWFYYIMKMYPIFMSYFVYMGFVLFLIILLLSYFYIFYIEPFINNVIFGWICPHSFKSLKIKDVKGRNNCL